MSRIRPVAIGALPGLAPLEQKIRESRGRISPLYEVLLNSPPVAEGWESMLTAVRNRNSLEGATREMIILRIATLNRAAYEFEAHIPHARACHVSDDIIEALRGSGPIEVPDQKQQAALDYAEAMTCRIEVDDVLFARVARHFQGQSLVDLTATIAAYNMVSRFLVALRIGE